MKRGSDAALLRGDAPWSCAGPKLAAAFRKGRFAQALAGLDACLARGSEEAWVFALRGEIKRAPGIAQFSEALEDAERACARKDPPFWVWGYAGRAAARCGKLSDAMTRLDKALALAPDCAWVLGERALVRRALKDAAGGLADAERACRLLPGSPRLELTRAACLLAAGRPAEALEALGLAGGAERDLSFPGVGMPDPRELRFEALRGKGRFSEAASVLKEAATEGTRLTWAPPGVDARRLNETLHELSSVAVSPALKPWLGFWKGEALLRLSRFEEADRELSGAIAAGPRLFWPRAARARARLQLGRLEEALADADAALSLKQANGDWQAPLLALRGHLGAKLGRGEAAAADLSRALKEGAPPAGPLFDRAQVWAALGRSRQAQEDLNRVLQLEPRHAQALVLRAQLRSRQGNIEGAMGDLARAKALPKPEASRPRLDLSEPAPRRELEREVPARRLGDAAVEPLIELVGLIQAVLDDRPFEIDAVRPHGEAKKNDPTYHHGGHMAPTFGPPDGPEIARAMTDYAREAVARFSPRIDEDLRKVFRRAVAIQGNAASPWYGLSQMMMSVSAPPELKATGPEWRHPENLRLLGALGEFMARTDYMKFFKARRPSFDRWTKAIRAVMCKQAYAATVSGYVGVPINAFYDVILSPMLRDVTLCAILKADGMMGARTVICPLSHVSEFYRAYDEDYLLWRGWHEILHMAIDRWTVAHEPEILPLIDLHAHLSGGARRHDWRDCVAEHMVRAATQRILRLHRGEEAMRNLAERDRMEGFLFQDAFAESLAAFESSRGVYPTLLDFFPEWLKVLRRWPKP